MASGSPGNTIQRNYNPSKMVNSTPTKGSTNGSGPSGWNGGSGFAGVKLGATKTTNRTAPGPTVPSTSRPGTMTKTGRPSAAKGGTQSPVGRMAKALAQKMGKSNSSMKRGTSGPDLGGFGRVSLRS